MPVSRRTFLERAGALGLVAALPPLGCSARGGTESVPPDTAEDAAETVETGLGLQPEEPTADAELPSYRWEGPPGPETAFECGVASADPLPNSVLLWTHVSPESGASPVDVFLELAADEGFGERLAASWHVAGPETDFTLTVDQSGLASGTTYYYRFSALGRTSPVGRTRTASDDPSRLRLAVASCASYAWGYFHAYRHLAARDDLDAVVHLGDYIYEHASDGAGRSYGAARVYWPPGEVTELWAYRLRYWYYRKDPDLQELHRKLPLVAIWDDHEFANNPEPGGAGNHQPDTEGVWAERVAAALQAYREWVPSRMGENGRIFRTLRFGSLAALTLVDRQRRFLFPADGDEGYLGSEQGAWLDGELRKPPASWTLLGTATRFASRSADGVGGASWDDVSRQRVLDAHTAGGGTNLVVLTGDTHRFDAIDVVEAPTDGYDPATGAGSFGVELACGSITSPGKVGETEGIPQYLWTDADHRGYLLIDVDPRRLRAEFWGFPDAAKEDPSLPKESLLARFVVTSGQNHAVPAPQR